MKVNFVNRFLCVFLAGLLTVGSVSMPVMASESVVSIEDAADLLESGEEDESITVVVEEADIVTDEAGDATEDIQVFEEYDADFESGADIARSEGYSEGVVPLHTLRSDIDFAWEEAMTTYG